MGHLSEKTCFVPSLGSKLCLLIQEHLTPVSLCPAWLCSACWGQNHQRLVLNRFPCCSSFSWSVFPYIRPREDWKYLWTNFPSFFVYGSLLKNVSLSEAGFKVATLLYNVTPNAPRFLLVFLIFLNVHVCSNFLLNFQSPWFILYVCSLGVSLQKDSLFCGL